MANQITFKKNTTAPNASTPSAIGQPLWHYEADGSGGALYMGWGGSNGNNIKVGALIEDNDNLGTSDTKLCTQGNVKAYADTMVPLAGGTMAGHLVVPTNYDVQIADAPSADTDAANKAYVDTSIAAGDTTLANTKVWIGDASGNKAEFALSGDVSMTAGGEVTVTDAAGDFAVAGDLTVNGDTTTVNTSTMSIEDPLMILANGNAADTVDTGFYAKYLSGGPGSEKYAGIIRDASTTGDPWTFFDSLATEPTTTVTVGQNGFDYADIKAGGIDAEDGFTGTVNTATQNSITTMTGLVSVGALDSGSITSGFTSIDVGSGTITTTGSLQVRTIDYSDGDLAMTIADGGAVTFDENTTLVGFVLDSNTITGIDDSAEFTDDDAHIMTSAAVQDKILGYSYLDGNSNIGGGTYSVAA